MNKISISLLFLITRLILTSTKVKENPLEECKLYIKEKKEFYLLRSLEKPSNFKNEDPNTENLNLEFNFCKRINEKSTGFFEISDKRYPINNEKSTITVESFILEENGEKGLRVKILNEKNVIPFNFNLDIICSVEYQGYLTTVPDDSNINVIMRDQAGCSIPNSQFLFYIEEKPYIFGTYFFLFGAFFILFGFKKYKIALKLFGFNSGFVIFLLFITKIWNFEESTRSQDAFIMINSLISGCFMGYLYSNFEKIGVLLTASLMGSIISIYLVSIMISVSDEGELSLIPKITFIVITTVCIGLSGVLIVDHSFILSCCVFGAYYFIRGIGCFFGAFPDEISVFRKVRNRQLSAIPLIWWVYLLVFNVVFTCALVYQFRQFRQFLGEVKKIDGSFEDEIKEDMVSDIPTRIENLK